MGSIARADVEKGDQNGIAFENSGWSVETRAALDQSAAKYPLSLVFALSNGDYVSDIRVKVVDSGGSSVFSLGDAGPIVHIGLPNGAYTVHAERGGRLQSRRVNVGTSTYTKAVFHWPKE